MIWVVSHPADDHATAVLDELERRGTDARLVDTADFPAAASVTLSYGWERPSRLVTPRGSLPTDDVGALWWRRPLPYTLDERLAPEASGFAFTETHEALSGLWHSLDAAWVNPPDADEVAHHKPVQLARARELGLPVPVTVITNDPDEARAFIARQPGGRTVYKTFVATETAWRETRVLRPGEEDLLDTVRLAPVIFQEYVEAEADLRVTLVGDDLHAAEIVAAPGGYTTDYRMDLAGARFSPTTLPDAVASGLRALLRRLGLVYGAVDLRRTASGEYVFLEVNPAGEWLFVEERTGLPITASMAALLSRLADERRDRRGLDGEGRAGHPGRPVLTPGLPGFSE